MGPAHQGGRDFCGLMVVKGPNRNLSRERATSNILQAAVRAGRATKSPRRSGPNDLPLDFGPPIT